MKNIEIYFEELKEELLKDEAFSCTIYKIRTRKNGCYGIACDDCHVKSLEWLNSEYVEPIKLTQFEYDLIWVTGNWDYLFNKICHLREMKNKGHFEDVDSTMKVSEILENCEVIDNTKPIISDKLKPLLTMTSGCPRGAIGVAGYNPSKLAYPSIYSKLNAYNDWALERSEDIFVCIPKQIFNTILKEIRRLEK